MPSPATLIFFKTPVCHLSKTLCRASVIQIYTIKWSHSSTFPGSFCVSKFTVRTLAPGKSHSLKKPDVLLEILQIHTVKGRNLEKKKPNNQTKSERLKRLLHSLDICGSMEQTTRGQKFLITILNHTIAWVVWSQFSFGTQFKYFRTDFPSFKKNKN